MTSPDRFGDIFPYVCDNIFIHDTGCVNVSMCPECGIYMDGAFAGRSLSVAITGSPTTNPKNP